MASLQDTFFRREPSPLFFEPHLLQVPSTHEWLLVDLALIWIEGTSMYKLSVCPEVAVTYQLPPTPKSEKRKGGILWQRGHGAKSVVGSCKLQCREDTEGSVRPEYGTPTHILLLIRALQAGEAEAIFACCRYSMRTAIKLSMAKVRAVQHRMAACGGGMLALRLQLATSRCHDKGLNCFS